MSELKQNLEGLSKATNELVTELGLEPGFLTAVFCLSLPPVPWLFCVMQTSSFLHLCNICNSVTSHGALHKALAGSHNSWFSSIHCQTTVQGTRHCFKSAFCCRGHEAGILTIQGQLTLLRVLGPCLLAPGLFSGLRVLLSFGREFLNLELVPFIALHSLLSI